MPVLRSGLAQQPLAVARPLRTTKKIHGVDPADAPSRIGWPSVANIADTESPASASSFALVFDCGEVHKGVIDVRDR